MSLLYPVFLLMFHTLIVLGWLGYRRYTAVSQGQVSPEYYTAYVGEEPKHIHVHSRHVTNLLQIPVLFYMASIIAVVTGITGGLVVLLAWLYVGLRLIHSSIHLGKNVVLWRFRVFVLSTLVLFIYLSVILFGIMS